MLLASLFLWLSLSAMPGAIYRNQTVARSLFPTPWQASLFFFNLRSF